MKAHTYWWACHRPCILMLVLQRVAGADVRCEVWMTEAASAQVATGMSMDWSFAHAAARRLIYATSKGGCTGCLHVQDCHHMFFHDLCHSCARLLAAHGVPGPCQGYRSGQDIGPTLEMSTHVVDQSRARRQTPTNTCWARSPGWPMITGIFCTSLNTECLRDPDSAVRIAYAGTDRIM